MQHMVQHHIVNQSLDSITTQKEGQCVVTHLASIFTCRAPGSQEDDQAGNFSTDWGPKTKFSKSNHPLAIMVCLFIDVMKSLPLPWQKQYS